MPERREDGLVRPGAHRRRKRGARPGHAHHGLLHARRSALLLRAGRRLHPVRRVPLLGHGPDPPQPADADVGHPRPGGQGRWSGDHHRRSRHRRSSACTGTRCPRCSRTPGSAGSTTTRPGRSTASRPCERSASPPTACSRTSPSTRDPTSALYQKAFLPTFPDDFAADVRAGTLPKVSWISTPIGYDEHPPAPSFLGEWFTDQVLRTLVSNPRGVVEDRPVPHVRRERRVLRPRRPAGRSAGHPRGVPLGPTPPAGRRRDRRADRPRVPGPAARDLARSAAGAGSARRPSTTPRSCGSSRSGSASRRRTSRRGVARPSGDLTSTLRMGGKDLTLPSLPADNRRPGLRGLQGLHADGPPRARRPISPPTRCPRCSACPPRSRRDGSRPRAGHRIAVRACGRATPPGSDGCRRSCPRTPRSRASPAFGDPRSAGARRPSPPVR